MFVLRIDQQVHRLMPFAPPGPHALAVAVLTLLVLLGTAVIGAGRAPDLPLGSREAALVSTSFYQAESDSQGGFRWTNGNGQIVFAQLAATPAALALRLGPQLPELVGQSMTLSTTFVFVQQPISAAPRTYRVLLPQRAGDLQIGLGSPTVVVADGRSLGLRVEHASVVVLQRGLAWPTLRYALLILLLLGALAFVLARLGTPLLATSATLVLAAVLLLAMRWAFPLLAPMYLARLAVAAAVLAGLTVLVLPLLERYATGLAAPEWMRALWGIAMLACAIRLVGALYPPFDAYDLGLNLRRFLNVAQGTLIATNRSIEFRNGVTVYPPGPYVVFLPLLLGVIPKLAVQAAIALVDGLGVLWIGLLARRLGTSERAGLWSALAYAGMPVAFTTLWYGLTAQVFGQALMAPLMLALLASVQSNRWRHWLLAGVLLSMALLTHIGVAILAVAWLALAWLWLVAGRGASKAVVMRFLAVLLVSGLVGFLFAYAPVFFLKIQQTVAVGEKVAEGSYVPAYNLIWRGWLIAFHVAGFWLMLPGLVLLLRQRLPAGGRALLAGWITAVLFFLAVELASGLQVRYMYFFTPLACLGIALTLDRLARLASPLRWLGWAGLVALLVQGCAIWYIGTYNNVAMSMVSLLR